MASTFLTAEWRKLVMANYAVDGALLDKYLPKHTETDTWNGTCYISLVGFMFLNTRIKGFRVPFHVNFEEVNLRFYVRHKDGNRWKRGVVFIKEIVPRSAITFFANNIYREHYETMPMQHSWLHTPEEITVAYRWKKGRYHTLEATAENRPVSMEEGSEAEFITEHFWGYTKTNDTNTSEYEVAHPRWQVYPVAAYHIDVDFKQTYGADFDFLSGADPVSVFLAEGSEIFVKAGRIL